MATNQQIIEQQRRNIEQAQKQARELIKKEQISKAQLLQKQAGLASRAQRQARSRIQKKAFQKAQAQIGAQERAFETQVAQLAPEYARKSYLEKAYQQARSSISGKLEGVQSRLAIAEEGLAKAIKSGWDTDKDIMKVRSLKAEVGTYVGALKGSKESLVKGHFSGSLVQVAGIASQQIEGKYERSLAKQRFAQQQGFRTFTEYQKALSAQQLPSVVSQVVQPGVATYDPSTGTYTSAEGYQSSIPIAHIPSGTQIVGPPLQYTPLPQYGYAGGIEAHRLPSGEVPLPQYTPLPQYQTMMPKETRVTIPERFFARAQDIVVGAAKKIPSAFEKTVGFVEPVTKPLLERQFKISIGPTFPVVGGLLDVPTGISYEEVPSIIKQTFKKGFEEVGEVYEYGYGITVAKLPEELQPTIIIPEKREEYKEEIEKVIRGETIYDPELFEKLTIKVTPEQVGKAAETIAELGTYVVPYVGATYLAAQFGAGVQQVRKPEKEAEKIVKEQIKQYEKEYATEEARLEPGYELEPKLTTEELEAQLMPAAIEQVRQAGAVEAVLSGAFLGGIGAAKVYQFGTRPITTITPTRALKKERAFLGEIEPVLKEGEITFGGEIILRGEKRPPLLIKETTPFRDLFGMKPLKTKEVPAIEYRDVSVDILTGERYIKDIEKPFLMIEKETGKRYATLYGVGGTATPIDLKAFMKLSKQDRALWRKFAEEKAGHSIPEKLVPKYFKEEAQLLKGEEVAKRLFRFKPGKEVTKITVPWKPGKRITQTESVIEIIPLKQKLPPVTERIELIKGLDEEVFKLDIVTRDITKAVPFKRVARKVDKTTGILIVKKLKDLTVRKSYGIQPAQIKKTPLAETFQVQIQKAVLDLKLPPAPKPSKIPTAKVVEVKLQPAPLPLMVGGVGLQTIPYEGLGLYERTEVAVTRLPSAIETSFGDMKITDFGIEPTLKEIQIQPVLVKEDIREELKIMPRLEAVQEMELRLREELVIKPISRFEIKQIIVPKIEQRLRQVPVLRTELRIRQVQVPVVRVGQRPRPPTPKPKIKPKIKPPLLIRRRYVPVRGPRLRPEVPKQGYNFEVRRKGKWERFKTPYAFATREGAEATAQDVVLREAAASYKIVRARKGKRVVKSGRKSSAFRKFLFRPGKEPGVKVQKKLLRILTPGEKEEISYAGGIARMKKAKLKFDMKPKKTKGRKKK